MIEADFQKLSTVHSNVMVKPATIASANVIAPDNFLTILTGDTVIKTITPPLPNSMHMIALQFAGIAGIDTTGNVLTTVTSVAGEIRLLIWNPITQKYIPVGA